MNSVVNIPVKNYIYKYLKKTYGNAFTYTETSTLAPVVRSVLSKSTTRDLKPFKYTTTYPIELTPRYISLFGVHYQERNLYQFNDYVDKLFRENLYTMMRLNKEFHGIKYRDTLRQVLKVLDISEEELKLDTLLRDFTRKHPEMS